VILNSNKFYKNLFLFLLIGSVVALFSIVIVFWRFSSGLPKIITVADYHPLAVTRILGDNGKEESQMGEFFVERRYLIPYEKMPERLVRAFVSAEDSIFFEHPGFNIVSMIRASLANFKAGHVVQGGSTITQQVAKSLLLTPERSFGRKIKELILSARIEKNLSKQQILYLYLNQIYLGHGAYGVQAAAKTYFRKDVSQITLAEAAILAGMPQAPSKYSPLISPKKAKERQLYVLRRMFENKYINQSEMTEAAAQPVVVYHDEDLNNKYSPYLIEFVRKYLVEKYGEDAVNKDGLTVSIPASPTLALSAEKSVHEGLREVDKRIGYRGPLQHFDTNDDIEKFLRDYRLKLIEEKVHNQVLMPDGHLDPLEAMRLKGIQNDIQLLDVGKIYQAVVFQVDDKHKTTGVLIGATHAELPLDKMRWAHPAKDEKNARGEPTLPSRVFRRGDVIEVAVLSNTDKGVIVQLDQEPQVQGALFSLETQTGNVLAMVGGNDYEQSEFNRATQAQRQPGSSFKPIIYSSALEKGYTPASVIVDAPIVYEDAESGKWKPSNFEEKFYGDTTFRQALIKSRNVPTIKIVQSITVPYVIEYAKRLGLNAQFNNDLSISLGSIATSLFEMTKVYALFPRLGRKVNPIFISKVVDREGRVMEESKPQPLQIPAQANNPNPLAPPMTLGTGQKVISLSLPQYPLPNDPDQVLDPKVAFVMSHLMKEVVTYGTGHEATNLGRPAAGKTGTTNDYIDAWFMGFTADVVTGVWVGFDNQKSIGRLETGARAALPIWLSYMREAVKPYPATDFAIPPGVTFASIDATSGKLASSNSSNSIKEAFIEGTQPTETAGTAASGSQNQTDFFKEDTE